MTKSNILLVEDDTSVAKVIVSALEIRKRSTVKCCDSVSRRDEMLKASEFDLTNNRHRLG